ncbi:MAG: alkyl sulfatase dimerization domain-containing protein [Ilumatobacteraceae bacterium]|jgi:alkyl sulfatase BDS1-like metallo-beta-lactamase superfamily hydrolase
MADLLDLSAEIIDGGLTDRPVNRVTNELSEVAPGVALVESFSHSVVIDTGDGLVAFDASGGQSGAAVAAAIAGWSNAPVRHLVYTHGHADHVGGSRAFAARWGAPTVIGHENVARRLDRYAATNDWNIRINIRQFGGIGSDLRLGLSPDETAPASGAGADWTSFIPEGTLRPEIAVTDHHVQTVGDMTFDLRHAVGETDDHLWGWIPEHRAVVTGDFVIWNFPNAGNPQKVQRYPAEWAAALRSIAAMDPDLLLPAHGLPIAGRARIASVLDTIAGALETLVAEVVAAMNAGETLDSIVHSVRVPDDTLALPYLRPLYDEPEFVVRNIWRLYGGWWDGAASRLKPAPDARLATVLADLAGGAGRLADSAREHSALGDHRLASHLADLAAWAEPDDPGIHRTRSEVYLARRRAESSLMSKGIFAAAARESQAVVEAAEAPSGGAGDE